MSSKSRRKASSILASPKPTKQHIRFDSQEKDDDDHQEKKDDGIVTTSSTSSKEMPSSKSQKRKKKRKRTASTTTTTPSSDDNNKMIFNGLILALSTDNKVHQSNNNDSDNPSTKSCSTCTTPNNNNNNNNNEEDQYETLKSLKSLLQSHGATISPQVHKRVHYLICTSSAITNLTQRIRQAIKRNVDIVSVDWVRRCIEEDRRVNVTEYICNEKVREIMLEKERDEVKAKGSSDGCNSRNETNAGEGYESDIPQDDNNGWSEPIQLDCCCVCHENGDDNCPWCTDCNINLAKKRMKETT